MEELKCIILFSSILCKGGVVPRHYLQVLPTIPHDQRTRVAHFLEKQGFKQQALAVSTDIDHK